MEIAESRSLIKITSKNDANNPKSRDKRLMTKDGYIQIGYLLLHQQFIMMLVMWLQRTFGTGPHNHARQIIMGWNKG